VHAPFLSLSKGSKEEMKINADERLSENVLANLVYIYMGPGGPQNLRLKTNLRETRQGEAI
jgi:hypothetical protein